MHQMKVMYIIPYIMGQFSSFPEIYVKLIARAHTHTCMYVGRYVCTHTHIYTYIYECIYEFILISLGLTNYMCLTRQL